MMHGREILPGKYRDGKSDAANPSCGLCMAKASFVAEQMRNALPHILRTVGAEN
jgi:hypothetical protein